MSSEAELVREFSHLVNKRLEAALTEITAAGGGCVYVEMLSHCVEERDGRRILRTPRMWTVLAGKEPPADLPERCTVYSTNYAINKTQKRESVMTPVVRQSLVDLLGEIDVLRRALRIMSDDVNPIIIQNKGLWEKTEQGIVDYYVQQARTEIQNDG